MTTGVVTALPRVDDQDLTDRIIGDHVGRPGALLGILEKLQDANRHKYLPMETLEYVAEPTATVTGLTFEHAAAAVGATTEAQQTMYQLGFAFGNLVYVLDALDDYEEDLTGGEFNALQSAFRLPYPAALHDKRYVPSLPGSTSATVEHSPEAIASRKIFIPHQPEPISAVLYFFPGWAFRSGAAESAD